MQRDPKKIDKAATISLAATDEVVNLLGRIRRKYVRAELNLNPDDDQPLSTGPGNGQILRAGLLLLDATLDVNKPNELVEIINRAKRRTGPQTYDASTPSNGSIRSGRHTSSM